MGIFDFFKKKPSSEATIVDRASKGTIRNAYFGHSFRNNGQIAPENLNVALRSYQQDPVVQSAITVRTDAILNNWYTIEGSKTPVSRAQTLLDSSGFNDYKFHQQVLLNLLLYQHVFIEIVRDGNGNPKEVHVLETPYVEIKHDVHGEITEYILRSETEDDVRFPPEDVVYLKTNAVTTAVWGEVGLKSLYRTLYTKNQMEKFIESMAAMNAWRQVVKTKMSDDSIEEFMGALMMSQADSTAPLIMQQGSMGSTDDTVFQVLRDPAELKEFLGLLDYYRTQILMYFKVPPIMLSLPDSSNRSNSDAQMQAFNTSNKALQKLLASGYKELFEKMGLSTVEFSWNPIDKRNEKDDMEIAERLINMGAKPKMVEQFLRSTGLELPEGELFEPKPDPMMQPPGKSEDMFPSRRRSGEDSNERIGTGSEGTTREDQLR